MKKIIFNIEGKALHIPESSVGKEKDIQKIFEDNLEEILDIEFVEREWSIEGKRVDTLGISKKNNALVIIEYKKEASPHIIKQGIEYLDQLEPNAKHVFRLLHKKEIKREVNWEESHLICVAQRYDRADIALAKRMNRAGGIVRILQYTIYGGMLLSIEELEAGFREKQDIPLSRKSSPDLEYHKQGKSPHVLKLFEEFRKEILSIDQKAVREVPSGWWIAYRLGRSNFATMKIEEDHIRLDIFVKKDEWDDPNGIEEVRKKFNGDYWPRGLGLDIYDKNDLEKTMPLIRESYHKRKQGSR